MKTQNIFQHLTPKKDVIFIIGDWNASVWSVKCVSTTRTYSEKRNCKSKNSYLACYSKYLLTSYFCIPILYDEKDIFYCISSGRCCRSSLNWSISASSASVIGAQTWITVTLNGLPWKRTEIILLFLRFHPSTAFQTLLLTMRATPYLIWNSCP